MAIRLKYQPVMAPSPKPATLTLPDSSTVDTEALASVYFTHRVTSCTEPSENVALTESCCVSPGLSVTCSGDTSSLVMRGSLDFGGGAPAAIHSERILY